ncbi:protocadherin gamma-A1-like isoform X1 [Octopus vulgaris]|uniref:Protocadherin gamma-A1-like isoform X1 n=1 Tax=Octopus vulgaris TaxID=6645 RepID=A0AA36BNB0_OCTVU|nr:protocadherin gamma-A1-like isoform X1 [Octopus vulgaris]
MVCVEDTGNCGVNNLCDRSVGSVIGQVKFRDWNLIKQVHSEKSVYVKYDPGTENVTLLKKIDADKHTNKITLRLFCEDRSSQTRNVTITVNIIATNVNDNPPRFTERVYYKEISEDTEIGSTIDCGVVATDGDNGDNMRFSILPDKDHEFFSINLPGTPLITLNQKLDYEKRRHLSIDIMVQDQPEGVNQKKLNDTATINFTVLDADDLNPVFTRKKYYALVNHNAELGTILAVEPPIEAYDPDYTFNETIKFSIDDADSTPFEIQPYNGTVYIKRHLEVGSTTYVIRAQAHTS